MTPNNSDSFTAITIKVLFYKTAVKANCKYQTQLLLTEDLRLMMQILELHLKLIKSHRMN